MGIGENVGECTGQNTGSSGSTYTGVTPVIDRIEGTDLGQILLVYFNTGIKTDTDYLSGFTFYVDGGQSILTLLDSSTAGNGFVRYTSSVGFIGGSPIQLDYLDSSGGINSILGDIQLADQSEVYSIPTVIVGDIFTDDLASGNFSHVDPVTGAYWGAGAEATVDAFPVTGSDSLKLAFPVSGGVAGASRAEKDIYFGPGGEYNTNQQRDVWIKADFHVPSNYYHVSTDRTTYNNKAFIWLWGGGYNDDFADKLGPKIKGDFWPVGDGRSKWAFDVSVWWNGAYYTKRYLGAAEGSGYIGRAINTADYGKKREVIIHFKCATTANYSTFTGDGIFDMWFTREGEAREKVCEIHNGFWLNSQASTGIASDGINVVRFLGTANAGFNKVTDFYFDNIVISTEQFDSGLT